MIVQCVHTAVYITTNGACPLSFMLWSFFAPFSLVCIQIQIQSAVQRANCPFDLYYMQCNMHSNLERISGETVNGASNKGRITYTMHTYETQSIAIYQCANHSVKIHFVCMLM